MGKGVEADDAAALRRFEQACDQGLSQACYHLGSMLMEGTVTKDPARAMACYSKACADGDPESCYFVGKRCLAPSGPGPGLGPRDPRRAEGHLATACGVGHAPSCRLLAVLYRNGDGPVAPDAAKFAEFKQRTQDLVAQRGSMLGVRVT